MHVKKGTVKFPGTKVVETSYGPKKNLVVTMADGTEEKIWFAPDKVPHSLLSKGDPVIITYETNQHGKPIRKLAVDSEGSLNYSPPPANVQYPANNQGNYQKKASTWKKPEPTKEDKVAYLAELTDYLEICIDNVDNLFRKRHQPQEQEQIDEIPDAPPPSDYRSFYNEATAEDKRAIIISMMINLDRKFN